MSDLAAAAAALNAPEAIVQRSAEARAAATGTSVDEVLAAWAAGGSAPATSPTSIATSPTATAATPPPAAAATSPTATGAPTETPEAVPETPAAAPTPQAPADTPAPAPAGTSPTTTVTRPPPPERVSPEEALDHPVVVSVPTANLKERTSSSLPRWLVAVFMIVPAFGLLYLSGALDAGAAACEPGSLRLAVDRATGAVENCDGTAFEGRGGAAGEAGAFITAGGDTYRSAAVNCAGCHGPNGEGGTGPALANVDVTFGSCADHIEWVRLGSAGWQAAGNSTYGDVENPIGGGMPGFSSLSEEDLRSVVAFERISFGGLSSDEVLTDCGLVEGGEGEGDGAEGEGEGATEGEGAVEGSADTGEGDASPEGGDIEGVATPDTSAPPVP